MEPAVPTPDEQQPAAAHLNPAGDRTGDRADHLLARDLAVAAGDLLVKLRARMGFSADPTASDRLRRAGDLGSQEFLATELARQRPGDAVLSEEAADNPARLGASRVWIIDPLDGTREFGEAGRTDWAVHVALWERGALTAGAVALPAQDTVLCTAEPPQPPGSWPGSAAAGLDLGAADLAGAHPGGPDTSGPDHIGRDQNGRDHSGPGRPLRLVVSRTRPPEFVQRLAGQLGAELIPLGSAGAKAAAVITGQVDAYVHSGGQYEWDSAAPVAVARSAGLHTSRIDGSELAYNSVRPSLPDILICPGPLSGQLLGAIRAVRPA